MDKESEIRPIFIQNDRVMMIDQNLLPVELKLIEIVNWQMMIKAIRDMTIRGAPAIGIAAAMGCYLAAKEFMASDREKLTKKMEYIFKEIGTARPTAVNLSWSIKRMRELFLKAVSEGGYDKSNGSSEPKIVRIMRQEAETIADEDFQTCVSIGNHGAELIDDGDGIITHCNAGALATGGWGTALGVIRSAHRQGKKLHVFVDETRPRLQGARLTAWELEREGIPFTLITDNMAGYFMNKGQIKKAIVGADRIASNGDFANKIGTYSLAVLAKEHGVEFYVAAPFSTFDLSISSGDEIAIEKRGKEEVDDIYPECEFYKRVRVANPAFDVTPSKYVSAIITEGGVITQPLNSGIIRIVGKQSEITSRDIATEK